MPQVTENPKIHFFNIPNLVSYFAGKLTYTSYLNEQSLKEAAQIKLNGVQEKASLKTTMDEAKEKFEKDMADPEEEPRREEIQAAYEELRKS